MSPLERENRELRREVHELKLKRRNLCVISIALFLLTVILISLAFYFTIKVGQKQEALQEELKAKGSYQEIIDNGDTLRDEIADVSNSICNCIINDAKLEAEEKIDHAKTKARKILAEKKFKVVFSEKYKLARPIVLSDSELNLLYHLVSAEAKGEGKKGQQAVCWVILNRVASSRYPNTIYSVIYAHNQFSPIDNGDIDNPVASGVKEAVREVLAGNIYDMTYGSLSFCCPEHVKDPDTKRYFNGLTKTVRIGAHQFYAE